MPRSSKPRAAPTAKPARPAKPWPASVAATQLARLRAVALALPETSERPSHGEPTFFAGKRVFVMFSDNHHNDGRLAAIMPVEPGLQPLMIAEHPQKFYLPAYVGSAGWVGVHLRRISDTELRRLVEAAWRLVAPKRAVKSHDAAAGA